MELIPLAGEGALPVALRSGRQVAKPDTIGPGRLLHQAYSITGRAFEKALGRAAHKAGWGPAATSGRIEKAFGDDVRTRQSRLDNIYDSFRGSTTVQNEGLFCALKKDCKKLLDYALP